MEYLLFIDRKSKAFQVMLLNEENTNNAMHVINRINTEKDNADLVRGYLVDAESLKSEGYQEDQALFDRQIIEYNTNQIDPMKRLVSHVRSI